MGPRGEAPLTVLLVDDHAGLRRRAREALEADGLVVVGEAADGAGALAAAARLRPMLIVLDVRLPDMSGLVVAGRLAAWPPRPVLVLTSTVDEADLGGAVARSGADAFVPKALLTGPALKAVVRRARPRHGPPRQEGGSSEGSLGGPDASSAPGGDRDDRGGRRSGAE